MTGHIVHCRGSQSTSRSPVESSASSWRGRNASTNTIKGCRSCGQAASTGPSPQGSPAPCPAADIQQRGHARGQAETLGHRTLPRWSACEHGRGQGTRLRNLGRVTAIPAIQWQCVKHLLHQGHCSLVAAHLAGHESLGAPSGRGSGTSPEGADLALHVGQGQLFQGRSDARAAKERCGGASPAELPAGHPARVLQLLRVSWAGVHADEARHVRREARKHIAVGLEGKAEAGTGVWLREEGGLPPAASECSAIKRPLQSVL
mmetsp:Transcript_503/g.1590  ORF Transcript_503/g.1590 Transcript_503/m.1590 type:complete len:261 (+) Transcript_503:130-912(+)